MNLYRSIGRQPETSLLNGFEFFKGPDTFGKGPSIHLHPCHGGGDDDDDDVCRATRSKQDCPTERMSIRPLHSESPRELLVIRCHLPVSVYKVESDFAVFDFLLILLLMLL